MLGPAARDTKPLTRLPHVAGVPVSKGGPEFRISLSYPVPGSTIGLELHCRHTAALVMQGPALSRRLHIFMDICKPAKIQLTPFAFLRTLTSASHHYCVSTIFDTVNTEFILFLKSPSPCSVEPALPEATEKSTIDTQRGN
jgi:hypothetical protein